MNTNELTDSSDSNSCSQLQPQPQSLVLDNSKKTTFDDCPRKYFHSFIQNLDTPELSVKLYFGTCWHALKQRYHKLLKNYSEKVITKAQFERGLASILQSAPKVWEKNLPPSQIVYPTYLNPSSLSTAFTSYLQRYLVDDIHSLEIKGVEEIFNIPMCTPSPSCIPFTLAGKIDLRGTHQGVNIILDDKTTGWNLFFLKTKNQRSSQLITYSYASRRLYEEHNEAAFKYLYISSRKKKDGEYGVLSIDFDFQLVSITESDIAQWEVGLIDTVERITKAEESGVWPQSYSRCFDYNYPCKFLPLCEQGRDALSTVITCDYIKREKSWDEELKSNLKEEM